MTLKPIRSFVLRQGRISNAQEKALDELMPKYGLKFEEKHIDLDAVFGRTAPKILEIGFGMGETSAKIASENPDKDYLGIEVHKPGVGSLLKKIDSLGLKNMKVIRHDAVEVLDRMITDKSLDGIHIFFPDPWHKKKHQKRRLIQPAFISLLCTKLKTGGYIHAATDWENYAEQILAVLTQEPRLRNTSEEYSPKPSYRPLTKFEQRGINLGHGVWDIVFNKV